MKMKIGWYENNLINMKKSYKGKKGYIELLKQRLSELKSNIDFLEYQIKEAKKIRKIEFDSDKFRKKRRLIDEKTKRNIFTI